MTAQGQNDFLGTVPNANPMASMISRTDVSNPSTEDWVNVFGPSGYNVQPDNTRNRKMGRVHLPDVLKVFSNMYAIVYTYLFITNLTVLLTFLCIFVVFFFLRETGPESMDYRSRGRSDYRCNEFALYHHHSSVHVHGLPRPQDRVECVDL